MDSTINKSDVPLGCKAAPRPVTYRAPTLKLLRFIAAGVPALLVAFPLNWFLVDKLALPKSGTYAGVLLIQTTANFFICRWFVFKEERRRPMFARFLPFLAGILLFRAADWALYTLLVSFLGLWYLGVQIGNAAAFALLKFAFARKVMEN